MIPRAESARLIPITGFRYFLPRLHSESPFGVLDGTASSEFRDTGVPVSPRLPCVWNNKRDNNTHKVCT